MNGLSVAGFPHLLKRPQYPISALWSVLNGLTPVRVPNDAVRWTNMVSLFDEDTICHQLGDVAVTWAAAGIIARLDLDRDDSIGSFNQVIRFTGQTVAA